MKKNGKESKIVKKITIWRVEKCLQTMLLLMLLCFSINGFGQTKNVTVDIRDGSIEDVLKEIQKQTGLNYLLNHEEVKGVGKISVVVKNANVEKLLKQCFKNTGLTYEIVDNVIVVKPKKKNKLIQTIRGKIIDKESKTGLPGANIILLNSDPFLGTVSDDDGYFHLKNVPVGRHTLRISYVGYKQLTVPEIMVGSSKEVVLTLQLVENVRDIEEIIVKPYAKGEPKNEMADVSSRSFSVEESSRYAGGVSDPGRMALSFAGVNTDDDLSNQIVVRGNTPNGMLWRMEGVQIPVPNHFYMEGWDVGYVSVLSAEMMGNSDFFTGAFPAEYGNGTSGVFDMTLRNGNNEKNERSFKFGLLGVDLCVEGPFSKNYKGSYLVNARYSTFAIMNKVGFSLSGEVLPEYSDVSFKINLPTKKIGTFAFWGLGGTGYYDEEASADSSVWKYTGNYGNETSSKMGASGLTHTIFPDSKSYFKTVFSYSGNSSIDKTYYLDTNTFARNDDYYEKLSSSAFRVSTSYNRKLSSKLTMKTGVIFSKQYFDYYSIFIDTTGIWLNDINGEGNTETYQGYLQFKYKISDKIHVNAGVHYMNFAFIDDYSFEPRLSIKWFLNNSQSISAGFGVHSRHEILMHYFLKEPDGNGGMYYPNKGLSLTKSNHFVLGYSKSFKNDLRFMTEVYYQYLYDLPVAADPNYTYSSINDDMFGYPLLSMGEGRNYGIELTLEKFFTNDYYFLITHSLYTAKYKPLDGKWYNSRYNNNYITNVTAGKEFRIRNKNILGLNIRFLWSGGRRGTPYIYNPSRDLDLVYQYEKSRYSEKYRDYMRLDLGIKYKINNPKVSHEFSIDIQNVTNRFNVERMYHHIENGQVHTYETGLTDILPFFNYKIEF